WAATPPKRTWITPAAAWPRWSRACAARAPRAGCAEPLPRLRARGLEAAPTTASNAYNTRPPDHAHLNLFNNLGGLSNKRVPELDDTEILMAVERTLSIIKPDAVGKNVIGEII